MKKFAVLICFISSIQLYAQKIENPLMIGGRIGISSGLTVKKFFSENVASETILATRFNGYFLTSLIEWHKGFGDSQLYLFAGAGLHISLINGKEVSWFHDEVNDIMPGLDVIAGVEYYMKSAPINFSIDFKPSINIAESKFKLIDGAAFSARFYFK